MRPTLPAVFSPSAHWQREREMQRALLQLLWVRQGGRLPVPWARLQADGELRQYHLIERCQLPDGVSCLRDPQLFDERETMLWAEVLRSPDRTGSRSFRYRQPAPGLVYGLGSASVPRPSPVQFPPDSLLFVRRQLLEHGSLGGRWGGLPVIPAIPDVVLSGEVHEWAVETAKDLEALRDLVEFVQAVEAFGPHQATRADYEAAASTCKYLPCDIPAADAGREHFVHHRCQFGPHMPPEFYSERPEDWAWGLDAILRWISGPAFVHRDGTLICGQLRFKWSVLMLLHLHHCGTMTAKGCGPYGPMYALVEVRWSQSNSDAIINCANGLLERIAETVYQLGLTAGERQGAGCSEMPSAVQEDRYDPTRFRAAESIDPADEWTEKNIVVTAGTPKEPSVAPQPAPKKRSHDRLATGPSGEQSATAKSGSAEGSGKRARSAVAEPNVATPAIGASSSEFYPIVTHTLS
ncbi:hypothetical protein FS749_013986 [Ceratobasidium sp. UAMH 11750]|nr:hypothetical protein FS749_013986 [Ceratobasidium sp. UAMH 11750]